MVNLAPLTLTVHRGTREIGGSCIQVRHDSGARLVLDAGRPLDAPLNANGLLPASLDLSTPATVLISHSHQAHHGLVADLLPKDWPIWTGEASARLIAITEEIAGAKPHAPTRTLQTWASRSGPFELGPIIVTPILTDHSAFDAYMLLVEAEGRRILYTGDFRRHGRKSALVDRLMAAPPHNVDVLVMGATNLGTDNPVSPEGDVEEEFRALFARIEGRAFVMWSGQNVDRTVTLYRAAKRTGRTLVVDLYTADVLDRIAEGTGLPRPGFPNLAVAITASLAAHYRRNGRGDFVARMALHGVAARDIPGTAVVMLRRALMRDYERAGVGPGAFDALAVSLWSGYLADPHHAEPVEWCRRGGAEVVHIHTSGHAAPADLRAFATAVGAKTVVPVHGANRDAEGANFANLRRLGDGEVMVVG